MPTASDTAREPATSGGGAVNMASTSLAPRLTGLSTRELECILSLPISRRGGPWARSLRQRLVIVCTPRSARTSPSASSVRCFARPGRKYIESCATSFHGWRRCWASKSTSTGVGLGQATRPTRHRRVRRRARQPQRPHSLPRLDHSVPVPGR
jgi:hypothetical protein